MESSAKRLPALLGAQRDTDGEAFMGPELIPPHSLSRSPARSPAHSPARASVGTTEEIVRALCAEIGIAIERLLARTAEDRTQSSLFSITQMIGALLTQIVYEEVGPHPLAHGVERALARLGASVVEEHLARTLLRIAQSAGAVVGDSTQAFDEDALTALRGDVREFVEWYVARRNTLIRIEDEQEFIEEEGIFGVHLCHDRAQRGTAGMEVACSLRLSHRAGQQLWLKATVYHAGQPVRVAREWFYWVDDTDGLSRGAESENADEPTIFAALAPLNPVRNACVIDTVTLFIPYQALDLSGGRGDRLHQDIEIETSLLDEAQNTIASRTLAVEVGKVTGRGAVKTTSGSRLARHAIPSPQAHGMWERDFVTGDSLSHIQISRGFRGGWRDTIECLTVSLDMMLRGHRGETVNIECRFLTLAGDVVKRRTVSAVTSESATTSVPSMVAKDFVASLRIHPHRAIQAFYDLKLEIPLVALDLPAGNQAMYVEVAALSAQNQVLAGILEPISVDVPSYLEDMSRVVLSLAPAEGEVNAAPSVVPHERESAPYPRVELADAVSLREHFNGREVVRLRPRVVLDDDATGCRVVISLERLNGKPLFASYAFAPGFAQRRLLQQSVCLSAAPSGCGGVTTFAFEAREIAASLELDGSATEGALAARVRVFSPSDQLLCEHLTQFPWRAGDYNLNNAGEERAVETAALVDLRAVGWASGERLRCRAWLNIDSSSSASSLRMNYEILDRSGIGIVSGVEKAGALEVPIEQLGRERSWYQSHVDIEVDLSELLGASNDRRSTARLAGTMLKISLFSDSGRLLQHLYHEILASGDPLIKEANRIHGLDRPEPLVKERSPWSALAKWLGMI